MSNLKLGNIIEINFIWAIVSPRDSNNITDEASTVEKVVQDFEKRVGVKWDDMKEDGWKVVRIRREYIVSAIIEE